MMVRLLLSLGIVAVLCSSAAADERARVRVVQTGSEPACLDLAAVARAVGRHASRAAAVVALPADGAAPGAAAVVALPSDGAAPGAGPDTSTEPSVRITADGSRARLELRRGGDVAIETFAIEPCDTLPEQIAAFVAGSLGAASDAEAAADAAADADAAAADAAAVAIAADTARRRRAERAALLVSAVGDDHGQSRGSLVALSLLAGASEVVGGGIVALDDRSDASRALGVGAAAVGILGGIGTIALGDSDHAEPWAHTTCFIGGGLLMMSIGAHGGYHDDFLPGSFVLGATYLTAGLGYGVQRLRHRNAASWRIRGHLARLANPEGRDRVTDAELAAAEADVAAGSIPASRWFRALPFFAGMTVSSALLSIYGDNPDQRNDLVSSMIVNSALMAVALLPTPIERFRKQLQSTGLDLHVAPTPSGMMLGASGSF